MTEVDTLPPGGGWPARPLIITGGLVVIVAALRAMRTAGTLKGADVTVVLTGDEERTGEPIAVARRDLIEAGRAADVALEYENLAVEQGRDHGTVARRSV